MHIIAIFLSIFYFGQAGPYIGAPQIIADCLCEQSSDTIIVNNVLDAGEGSLRCAILCANTNTDYSIIRFELGSDSTIVLQSSLPVLEEALSIECTQGKITIDGQLLTDPGQHGFRVSGENIRISGLRIENFPNNAIDNYQGYKYVTIHDNIIINNGKASESGDGIDFRLASNCSITNNHIQFNNKDGIYLQACSDFVLKGNTILENHQDGINVFSGDFIMIGDSCNNCSNLISGNGENGIKIFKESKHLNIFNNIIGLSPELNISMANGVNGIKIENCDSIILGGPGQSNYISGNGMAGIELSDSCSYISIRNNQIGLSPFPNVFIPNTVYGVKILRSEFIEIGGDSLIYGNYIGYNPVNIYIGDSSKYCSLRHNEFNCSINSIQIEAGSNEDIPINNSFEITNALMVQGNAEPNSEIQLYKKNNECVTCQGSVLIGTAFSFDGTWEIELSEVLVNGDIISCIITDSSGNSSEFSDCLEYECESFEVTISPIGLEYLCEGGELGLQTDMGESFLWSTGETSSEILVSSGGYYSVTVLNDLGCPGTDSFFVDTRPGADLSFSIEDTSYFCGNSMIIKANGTGFFEWDSGTSGPVIEVTESGTYCVSLTNIYDCVASDCVTIIKGETVDANIQVLGDTVLCNGESTLLVASGGSVYKWSTGEYNQDTIKIVQSGSYSVTVTNDSGCEDIASQEIIVHPAVNGSILPEGQVSVCEGDSTVLIAQGGTQYLWNNGSENPELTVGALGIYYVTIENEFGCQDKLSKIVSVLPKPEGEIVLFGTNPFCDGDSIVLKTESSALDSLVWNNTIMADSIVVFESGVFIADMYAFGCHISDTVQIIRFLLPETPQISGPDWSNEELTQKFLIANPQPDHYYQWSIEGGYILSPNGNSEILVHWQTADIGELCVVSIDTNDCQSEEICKQIDIAPLRQKNLEQDLILLFPNPSTGTISIALNVENTAGEYRLKIYDQAGAVQYDKKLFPDKENNIKDLDISTLYPGTYSLTINQGSAQLAIKKLVLIQ